MPNENEWQEAQSGDAIAIQKGEIDKEYVGYYLSQKTVENEMGESILWKFQDKEGEKFSIWGFASLNAKIENVLVGTLCKIIYLGQAKKKNKYGKFPHLCKVLVSSTQKLDASADPDDGDVPL